jgi:alpha-L-fucosidase
MKNSNAVLSYLVTTVILCLPSFGQNQPAPAANTMAEGGNSPGYDMAPETRLEVVEAVVAAIPSKIPAGLVKPNWNSLKRNYKVPRWYAQAKFGLSLHWGLYSVPAYHNEWYEKHMYGMYIQWHREHFGPQDNFGYKDFIPMFTAEKFDPKAWAELFKKSGAKWVAPTVQHHDNFALWDSRVTPFNAMQMGPKRDLMGELARAVRAEGLKFGVCNHGIENFQFINPPADLAADLKAKQADLYDPKWADFYNVADRSDEACKKFLVNWAERNVELIDKFRPDVLWFDNGVDIRYMDPLKLWIAAYYYNRAAEWDKQVSIVTKKAAYAPSGTNTQEIGSIIDFEKIGPRSPSGIRTGVWEVHEPIGSTWGYTSDMRVSGAVSIIARLADTVSKNGNLFLNLSPKADGTIPQEQQNTLLEVGQWLQVNGDAIYGTHNWIKFGEGVPPARGGASGTSAPEAPRGPNIRFTVKGDNLYAIILGDWPGKQAVIASLATGKAPQGKIKSVTLLGHKYALKFLGSKPLRFTQDAEGLKVKLPATAPCKYAYTLRIIGLKVNPSTATVSGNPQLSPENSSGCNWPEIEPSWAAFRASPCLARNSPGPSRSPSRTTDCR